MLMATRLVMGSAVNKTPSKLWCWGDTVVILMLRGHGSVVCLPEEHEAQSLEASHDKSPRLTQVDMIGRVVNGDLPGPERSIQAVQ